MKEKEPMNSQGCSIPSCNTFQKERIAKEMLCFSTACKKMISHQLVKMFGMLKINQTLPLSKLFTTKRSLDLIPSHSSSIQSEHLLWFENLGFLELTSLNCDQDGIIQCYILKLAYLLSTSVNSNESSISPKWSSFSLQPLPWISPPNPTVTGVASLKKCFAGTRPINVNLNTAQSSFHYSDARVFSMCAGPIVSVKSCVNLLTSAK